ncbi:MAG: DUF4212 domain-containing protein [Trichlorobacter sp.]|nr:DUF4212 domain-containing protein [Trichlorobacter sp.]
MSEHNQQNLPPSINFFKPRKGTMAKEVKLILLLLIPCILAVFVCQFGIFLLLKTEWGMLLDEIIIFNLPVSYWVTGQLLPLWFILVGVAFNIWLDRNENRHVEAIRYRAKGRSKEEMS